MPLNFRALLTNSKKFRKLKYQGGLDVNKSRKITPYGSGKTSDNVYSREPEEHKKRKVQ